MESPKSSREERRHPVSSALLSTLGDTIGMGDVLLTQLTTHGVGVGSPVFSRKLEEVNSQMRHRCTEVRDGYMSGVCK